MTDPNLAKPSVLVLVGHYLPGYKGGGTIRAIAEVVAKLKDRYDFWILAMDRDMGDSQPFPNLPLDQWLEQDGVHLRYDTAAYSSAAAMATVANEVDADLVYLNSFFAPFVSMFLMQRRLGRIARRPVIVAPRGQFMTDRLKLKSYKKGPYLAAVRAIRLYSDVWWHSTTDDETASIQRLFGMRASIGQAADLPSFAPLTKADLADRPPKVSGSAEFVVVSRVSPEKNMLHAIRLLQRLNGQWRYRIYGDSLDAGYMEQVKEAASNTSLESARVEVLGPIPNTEVPKTNARAHFFLMPTVGENYGYAIYEALAAGCPAVISDQTPWTGLTPRRAGWDIPLANTDEWLRVLQHCIDMTADEYAGWQAGALAHAGNYANVEAIVQDTESLLLKALGRAR